MSYHCPNGCKPRCDTPFYYPPCCLPDSVDPSNGELIQYELGVLVYPDLTLSNRWTDGTVGIPTEFEDWFEGHDCMPHCLECGEEITGDS